MSIDDMMDIVIDNGDCCLVCKYSLDCHGMSGGPNGPIYPYCAEHDDYSWVDEELLSIYIENLEK